MESSRIFVRGLPPTFTEDEFRKHFSKFSVTDAKLFPHRRIGYVGYKTPEDAAKAVKYFNKSFIRMSRIGVEIARAVSDENLPKSRRQRQKEKNALSANTDYVPPPRDNPLKRKRDEQNVEDDPKLKEFLAVMQPPSKSKSWANEQGHTEATAVHVEEPMAEVPVPAGDSDDEYQVVTKKSKKTPEIAKENIRDGQAPARKTEPLTVQEVEASEEKLDGEVTEAPIPSEGPVSDADWLRSRTSRLLGLDDDDGDDEDTPKPANVVEGPDPAESTAEPLEEDVAEPQKQQERDDAEQEHEDSNKEAIRKTGRLFLRNLPYDAREEDLRRQFSSFGNLEEVHVPISSSTGTAKGFAYLQFSDPEHAVEAYSQNDGTIFQGRLLHIIPAAAKRDSKLDDFAISKLPLKKQKEIRRKADASSSTFNWNSLYLNTDAVMSSVADRLGISKAELLDPTSSDAAVKQAHAETHVLSETKAYFAQHGVDLEAFKKSAKGDTAILVKNIPHRTSPDELRKLFEEHGTVKQLLMPPSGMTAIVEFANPAQTRSAFKSLAYRKMKDSILFLEKAPKDVFKEGVQSAVVAQTTPSEQKGGKLSATDLLQEAPPSESVDTATLFVRNLNFSTTTQRLKEIFSPLDGFQSARVKTKVDPKRGVLSMGFGFLEFKSTAAAQAAMRAMDGYSLDGHSLQIRASHKGVDAAEERRKEDAAKKAAGTKIIIKNLPFEASKKDVRALFAPYGQLRSVRVPKKFDSKSRGFAFAEFTTKREAANAMDALRNTHLLGRRLVLAFAEAGSDDPEKELEKMQDKVGSQVNKVALQRLTGGGRKKFNVAGNDDLEEV